MSPALIFSVQILQRDKSGQEKAPQVIQEELNKTAPKGSRQYSTSARRARRIPMELMTFEDMMGPETDREEPSGHEFELPSLPLPRDFVMKYRYDPIIKQFTNLMMRDGKLSKAQRVRQSVSLPLVMISWHRLYANCIRGRRTLL